MTDKIKELNRTIKLAPVKVMYTSGNRIPQFVYMKREATVREALHILRNILGFNIDYVFEDCEDNEEKSNLRKELTEALNGFLKGGDYAALCDATYCYDEDPEGPGYAPFLWMASYCQEKGIF